MPKPQSSQVQPQTAAVQNPCLPGLLPCRCTLPRCAGALPCSNGRLQKPPEGCRSQSGTPLNPGLGQVKTALTFEDKGLTLARDRSGGAWDLGYRFPSPCQSPASSSVEQLQRETLVQEDSSREREEAKGLSQNSGVKCHCFNRSPPTQLLVLSVERKVIAPLPASQKTIWERAQKGDICVCCRIV